MKQHKTNHAKYDEKDEWTREIQDSPGNNHKQSSPSNSLHYILVLFSFIFSPFHCLYRARRDPRQSAVADFDCALCSIHFTRIYFSICIFVDALVAIYKLRVLVKYVCNRYVCTPSLSPAPPPLEVELVGCSPLVGGTRQQASLEARWTRDPAGLWARTCLFYRNNFVYHQQLTFRLSGNTQQNQKQRIELFCCHRV